MHRILNPYFDFGKPILNRILNWISFCWNSNFELNCFGYRAGLSDHDSKNCYEISAATQPLAIFIFFTLPKYGGVFMGRDDLGNRCHLSVVQTVRQTLLFVHLFHFLCCTFKEQLLCLNNLELLCQTGAIHFKGVSLSASVWLVGQGWKAIWQNLVWTHNRWRIKRELWFITLWMYIQFWGNSDFVHVFKELQ